MTETVTDHDAEARYELTVDGDLAAVVEYTLRPGVIALNHTETRPGFEGHGVAGRLVREVLADARARGLAVLPFCPYVNEYIRRHPDEYLDLVPADRRERFDLPAA
jgi:predicted GNAT family acetyltransferase